MCHGHPCVAVGSCPLRWYRTDGKSTYWAFDSPGHHFRAHEDRTPCGRVVHTHEAAHGGVVNMRYEATPGRQQWLIDQVGPAPPLVCAPVLVNRCPLPTPSPAQVHVPALIPVMTHTHTHTHSHTYNVAHAQLHHTPHAHCHLPTVCGTSNFGADPAAKAAAEAATAAAKRDTAAKDYESAKASYEAILAHAHEGKDDEWAKYWADLARYYRQLGHQTEAKAVSEKRLSAFNIDNFWGWSKT